jgi:hypothetical protein
MRIRAFTLLALATLPLAGCFQSSTLIRVKADGSGTIQQRLLLTEQALDQLRAFTILGGGNADNADPTAEPQARALAAAIGPGVTYVSSMPIADGRLQGRESIYSFADITQLRISEQPSIAGGPNLRAQGLNTSSEPITFAFARKPDGNVVLRILVPRPGVFPTGPNGTPQAPTQEQINMVKQLLSGARLTVAVEPEGRLVQTTSPFVEGNRVTLIDVDIDKAGADPDLAKKLQGAKTPEDTKAALNSVPGVKITLDPEISIEFAPMP